MPCDPVDTLNILYGNNEWVEPKETSYKFHNQLIEHKTERSMRELPFMFRAYDINGNLDIQQTLNEINKFYFPLIGRNLTELPTDDLDFL